MKSEAATYGPLWTTLLESLAAEAPDPASQTLCLNLRPAWERSQVQQLHAQTREMQQLQPVWPALPQKADWLRPLLGQPGAQTRDLSLFLTALETLRRLLQAQAQTCPALWKLGQELQPDPTLLAALPAGRPLSPEAHRLLQQRQNRLKAQQELLARLGLIQARARFGTHQQRTLAQIGGGPRLRLQAWKPERLSQLTLDFELSSDIQVVVMTGAHGSGKTRLLQSLYLACLMHQAGLPLNCASESILPVFNSLTLLEAEAGLQERLDRLKPLLRSPQGGRLLLMDDFPVHTSPGEAYALGRALLERLNVKGALTLVGTHQTLLTRMASPTGPVRALALQREGSRQGGKLELLWQQSRGAGLIERARQAGWPSELLRQAEQHQQSLTQPRPETPPARKTPPPQAAPAPRLPLKPISTQVPAGSRVYLPALNLYGELLNPPDRRQRVQIRTQGMTLEVSADQVVLSSHRKEKKGDTSGIKIQTWSLTGDTCDLHGLTVDEALPLLDKFLDTAYYQGINSVRIVHGKGTSALRKAVQQHLSQTAFVRSYRLGHPGEGDSGVTVAEIGEL